MKRMLIGLVALGGASLLGVLATDAAADARFGRFDRVDQRRYHQQERIRHGLAAGRLTRDEYRFLAREQNQIGRLEAHAEADGRVTPWERARIERAQDEAGRNIARLVRDTDSRGGYGRYGQYR